MAKSANLYARIEPEVKEQAEKILSALGINASNAINMFYKQVILNNGLPFEVKIPQHPHDIAQMADVQRDHELEKGFDDVAMGRTVPYERVFSDLREDLGI